MVNVLSIGFSALFLVNSVLVGAASNSRARRHQHSHGQAEAIQKRSAEEYRAAALAARSGSNYVGAVPRKRVAPRCKGRNSTTTTTTSTVSTTTTPLIGNPGGDPTTTPASTTSSSNQYKHSHHKTRTPTPPETTSSDTPATTSKASGGGGGGGGGGGDGTTYSGDGTYYGTGLGSCGWTNQDTDYIAAVSHILYDSWPGAGDNPNANPICGRYATAHYGGNSVRVKIADRCTGCEKYDLDFSPSAFSQLASQSLGRIHITWEWS